MLRPLLERKVKHSWVNPKDASDRDQLMDDYLIGWGAAQAINELLRMEAMMADRSKALKDKQSGKKVDNFKEVFK